MSKFILPFEGRPSVPVDCSDPYQLTYIEVPPMAIDDKTGEVINSTVKSILVPGPKRNIDDFIQSFKDETDIYTIISKALQFGSLSSDNPVLASQPSGFFADTSSIPNNLNDSQAYFAEMGSKFRALSDDEKELVFKKIVTSKDIEKIIEKKIAELQPSTTSVQANPSSSGNN